jgi:signal transduction histidine kinase
MAHLTVADLGVGIAPEHIERIFDRFERVETPNRTAGLGLGLYIVREIVSAHGGTIRVKSEIGEGATFVVELPR